MQKKRSSKNLFGKSKKREIKKCPVFCGTPCIYCMEYNVGPQMLILTCRYAMVIRFFVEKKGF
jgi:hypothetical protein